MSFTSETILRFIQHRWRTRGPQALLGGTVEEVWCLSWALMDGQERISAEAKGSWRTLPPTPDSTTPTNDAFGA